jgi:hypothetical protein
VSEHQEWTENGCKEKGYKAAGLYLERQQPFAPVKRSTGNQTGKRCTLTEKDGAEGVGALAQKGETGAAIGMSRD